MLVVDGAAFLYSLSSVLDTPASLLGGEYDLLVHEVQKFVGGVRSLRIAHLR